MERVKIKGYLRDRTGKEISKKERRQKLLPAIVYGKDINLALKLPLESQKILKSINFSKNSIIDMEIQEKEKKSTIPVLIKDVQYHPLDESVIHIDFIKVSLEEKIKVSVPIVLKGEAKGIKDGGILQQILWSLDIEGLPLDIPEKIELDITDLTIGRSIHAKDIKLKDTLKILTPSGATIVTIVEKVEEELVTTTAEVQPEGPEVIKEKKEEEVETKEEEKGEKEEKKDKEEKKE